MRVNDAADSYAEFDCLKKEQKGIRYFLFFLHKYKCWNWKICNNDEHMLLKHEVIFFLNLFIEVCFTCSLSHPPGHCWKYASFFYDEQTVRLRALLGLNSVCLIPVESSETWLVCGTIKKPPVCVFLTTVTYHHLWLHWNNKKTNKHVFCKFLYVNKRVYFYPPLACWMCVSVQDSAVSIGTSALNSPRCGSAMWQESGFYISNNTNGKIHSAGAAFPGHLCTN